MEREDYLESLKSIAKKRSTWNIDSYNADESGSMGEMEFDYLREQICANDEEWSLVEKYLNDRGGRAFPAVSDEDREKYIRETTEQIVEDFKDEPIPDDIDELEYPVQEWIEFSPIEEDVWWFDNGKKYSPEEFVEHILTLAKENGE